MDDHDKAVDYFINQIYEDQEKAIVIALNIIRIDIFKKKDSVKDYMGIPYQSGYRDGIDDAIASIDELINLRKGKA
jgi:hypothetical protein